MEVMQFYGAVTAACQEDDANYVALRKEVALKKRADFERKIIMSYISTADLAALSSPMSAYKTTTATRDIPHTQPNGPGRVGPALEAMLALATSLLGSLVLWTVIAGPWIH